MKDINRRVILKKRNRLNKTEIIKKSESIKKKLFNSIEYKKAETVMFYASFGSEVHTLDMIKEALKDKTVCVPVVKDHLIFASTIKSLNDLDKKDKFGILEPSKINKIDKRKIDLVIVPGVCFDKLNHRIGYGIGYYDGFLKGFKGKKIGLAFKIQILEVIPCCAWDVTLDKVISEG